LRPKILDDPFSYLHILYGVVTALFLPYSAIIPFIYLGYQLWEKESLRAKIGDFLELALGIAIGAVLRVMLQPLLDRLI